MAQRLCVPGLYSGIPQHNDICCVGRCGKDFNGFTIRYTRLVHCDRLIRLLTSDGQEQAGRQEVNEEIYSSFHNWYKQYERERRDRCSKKNVKIPGRTSHERSLLYHDR